MTNILPDNSSLFGRRIFLKQMSACAAGLGMNSLFGSSDTQLLRSSKPEQSCVSFTTSADQREAAYNALKPLKSEIEKAIGNKQVLIKINMPHPDEKSRLGSTHSQFVRGILDFLKEIHDKKVYIGEGSSQLPISISDGYKNYDFMPLEPEYNAKCIDLNDENTTPKFIKSEKQHPLKINVINTYLDPNIYIISATRIKTHASVTATLSLKNIAMGAPVNYYKQKGEKGRSVSDKPKMHEGGNRGLSYNLFRLATMGIQPDLAALDGVVAMEGDGPWGGTAIEHGVALASTDWLAADRLAVELMGIKYDYVKYLQWCGEAGMGQDDLSKITIIGPDYKSHIAKYKLNKNFDKQVEWIREDYSI